MDYEPSELNDMPALAAVVHQLASPRTVKAVIVYVFLLMLFLMILQGIDIPEIIASVLLLVVGSFFEPVLGRTTSTQASSQQSKGQS